MNYLVLREVFLKCLDGEVQMDFYTSFICWWFHIPGSLGELFINLFIFNLDI